MPVTSGGASPTIDPTTERLLGWTATAAVVVSSVVLTYAVRSGALPRRRWRVLVPLVLLAAFDGAAWRVATAATPGYDVGSTLAAVVFGVPFAVIVNIGRLVCVLVGVSSADRR